MLNGDTSHQSHLTGYQELFSYPKGLTSDSVAAEFITVSKRYLPVSPESGSIQF